MTRVIASLGAVLVAAVVLAGCGGSGSASSNGASASGSVHATTSGVAGAQTTKTKASGSASFNAQVRGFEQRLQKAVKQFRNGNLAGAATSGSTVLTNCEQNVNKLATRASTASQKSAVKNLRSACADITTASQQGAKGNLSQAKSLAGQALMEAKQAVRQLQMR